MITLFSICILSTSSSASKSTGQFYFAFRFESLCLSYGFCLRSYRRLLGIRSVARCFPDTDALSGFRRVNRCFGQSLHLSPGGGWLRVLSSFPGRLRSTLHVLLLSLLCYLLSRLEHLCPHCFQSLSSSLWHFQSLFDLLCHILELLRESLCRRYE